MEFVIKQSVLKEELGFVQGIVEKKSTIPVLSNILIESVGEGTIRIVGTDLDVTIRCETSADIKQSGSMCIQARKLFDIVRLLDNADVHFTKEENEWVKLSCGKSNFRLAGVSREQFPEVPEFRSTPLKLSAKTFNHFIQHTSFAITQEQSRFTLSGAKFMVGDGVVRMVTTDGHRLAFIEKQETIDGTMDALIPKKALTELTKISRDSDGEISFGEDPNHIYFEVDGRLLITRKLSGTFPNYEMVIPKGNDKTAIFDAEEMKAAIRRVSLMADERTRSVKLNIKNGEIEISSQAAEEGEAQESIVADYSGEEVMLGFNSAYMQDFLGVIGGSNDSAQENETEGETVRVKDGRLRLAIDFRDGNAQTLIRPEGDNTYDYKYIVMPLRI
ncbi:MAG: DNA polymerase III subunit beta [Pyrinomonadaceae bacterium]|jgi:DNA polymerase-3 subunit beta|nr:DNA polymerase III subunit beta [Pyrinomonadaceae bacterium]